MSRHSGLRVVVFHNWWAALQAAHCWAALQAAAEHEPVSEFVNVDVPIRTAYEWTQFEPVLHFTSEVRETRYVDDVHTRLLLEVDEQTWGFDAAIAAQHPEEPEEPEVGNFGSRSDPPAMVTRHVAVGTRGNPEPLEVQAHHHD